MSNKTAKLIRMIYGIALSVLLIVTGVLLMVSCVNIYKIGDRPFTVENISNAFGKIAILVYITLGVVVIGVIMLPFIPTEKSKLKAIKDERTTLARLQSRFIPEECAPSLLASIKKEKTLRFVMKTVTAVLCVALAIPCLIYAFNRDSAPVSATLNTVVASFIAIVLCIALTYIEKHSIKRETEHVKSAIASQKSVAPLSKKPKKSYKSLVLGIRITIAILALVFIVAGVFNNGMTEVLSKAVIICQECIGIG